MIRGLVFLLATGIFWAGLAAIVARAAARNLDMKLIQPVSAVMVLLVTAGILFYQPGVSGGGIGLVFQIACLMAAGAANYGMLTLVQRAMASGNNGVVWAFTQSSMTLPFAVGIVLFGEAASGLRISGLTVILSALCVFSVFRSTKTASGWEWLRPTLGAFLLSGMAQSFASLPSYLQIEGMTGLKRMALTQVGILLAAGADLSFRRKMPRFNGSILFYAALFGGCNLAALLFFYNGLNDLADAKCASIGYPAAQGISIALFFLAGRFTEKARTPRSAWYAFGLLLSGVLLIILDSLRRAVT